jgi:hypothetical protein
MVAIYAIVYAVFAIAIGSVVRLKERAFQASSPKTSKARLRPGFFALLPQGRIFRPESGLWGALADFAQL